MSFFYGTKIDEFLWCHKNIYEQIINFFLIPWYAKVELFISFI